MSCAKTEKKEKVIALHRKAGKELLEVHVKRIALLDNEEQLDAKLHNNTRKMHQELSTNNDEIEILKDKVLYHKYETTY